LKGIKKVKKLAVLALAIALFAQPQVQEAHAELRIAYAASGADGDSALRGIELYLEEVNRSGGIGGNEVVVDRFDDRSDPKVAAQVAETIAADGRYLAVIGHGRSACSVSAGRVYADKGVPALTFSSTDDGLTRGNDWYFRTIYNDQFQGQFLANYIHKVFPGRPISMVVEEGPSGRGIAEVFERTAAELDLKMGQRWDFDPRTGYAEARLEGIAAQALKAGGVLFLAVGAETGGRLVQLLRDRGHQGLIVGPDSFSSPAFRASFAGLRREEAQSGFYTNGLLVAVPLLFDTANRRAQQFGQRYSERYAQDPDWRAAYAYDAAALVVAAFREAGDDGETAPDRRGVRDFLAGLTQAERALEGVTGPTYFDAEGNAPKAAAMGVYTNGDIVSASTQFQLLGDINETFRVDPSFSMERVVAAGDHYLYRTHVVYTGVRANSYTPFDVEGLSYGMDFYLWFRYQGDIDVEAIEFLNAVDPIELGSPVEETVEDGTTYRLYRIQGRFRADYHPAPYGHHTLGLSFKHREQTRLNLIYAIDWTGMRDWADQNPRDRLKALERLLDPQQRWSVVRGYFFQDLAHEHTLGHPKFFATQKRSRDYSRFNIALEVKKNEFTLRGLLPPDHAGLLSVLSGLVVLGLELALGRTPAGKVARPVWFLQAAAAGVLLVATEAYLGVRLGEVAMPYQLAMVRRAFDMLWWAVPAVLLGAAVSRFIWQPLEEKSGRGIPTLLRRFIATVIYTLAFFGIVAFVFDRPLTGLLATSGVIAMIIGLAIQINISNIFSGIAINLERPFRLGDWIMVHGRTPNPEHNSIGRVIDINWRATRLVTTDRSMVVIPNSLIAERIITNFMVPEEVSRFELLFWVDFAAPSDQVIATMTAAIEAVAGHERGGPLTDPPFRVRVNRTTELGVEYQVRYCIIPRVVSPAKARHTVSKSIVDHMQRAGINLAYPRRSIHYTGLPADFEGEADA
jgi:potassium-dependent mechanosensitive channel